MNFTSITIEGGILPPDLLERLADQVGQKPADFGLTGRRTVVDEVSAIWSDVRSYWEAFQRRLARAHGESLVTITREQWVIPLLEALGYHLVYQQRAADVDGRTYRISHRTGESEEDLPVSIEAYDHELGNRPASGRGAMSPHAMLQDYLNRTEHLWGIVTNGSTFRLLRDSSYFTRPAYIEFDLRSMLEGDQLDEFILFYRLVHRSRLPRTMQDGPNCLLEQYHQQGIEQGGRIRDGLRDAVEKAIVVFGNGFLKHPNNDALREAVASGSLTPLGFYQQLLYLIYRLLFLMVAEERNLLTSGDGGDHPARQYFTISRLRALSEEPLSAPERFSDLYLNLRALFASLCKPQYAELLGLPPLNGELFDSAHTRDVGEAYLYNGVVLQAIRGLSSFVPKDEKVRRRVNYGALDVEELGSVYESLLDFQPLLRTEGTFEFSLGTGTQRKTTGSYYTRPELVQELIKSALEPVIEDRLTAAGKDRDAREHALLALKVCDPACGSGHFLLAAARRIGTELARVRTGEEAPAPEMVRAAVRDVITHCIYGVDKNPLAVDLCKVALWIEGHSGGKPLTFLDHRIRCGDSLVGVFDLSVLEQGIPDEAYTAVTGDDKAVAKAVKAQNKREREGLYQLPMDPRSEIHDLTEAVQELETLADDTPEQIHQKRAAFERLQEGGGKLWRDRMECNLWTAAFFSELTPQAQEQHQIPTTADLRRFIADPDSVDARLRGHVWALAERNRFFHWPLEFPEVFEQGGFDCVLGNPPFVNVISGGLEERAKKSMAVRLSELGGTADLAVRFLSHACRITQAGGWVAMIQPRAMLNARPAEAFRSRPPSGKAPRMLAPLSRPDWFHGAAVFVALVTLGPPGPCRVPALVSEDLGEWRNVEEVHRNWFEASASVNIGSDVGDDCLRLGDFFVVQASMTTGDAYDAVPFLVDAEAGEGQRLATTGLIEPFECQWGKTNCRYLKRDYRFPRIVVSTGMPKGLRRRMERSRRPKVLLAGLGSRVEAFVDHSGEYTGAVSTFTVYDPEDDVMRLDRLCEFLNSKPVTSRFRAKLGANALGGGSITMRKDWLTELPVPRAVVDPLASKVPKAED